MLESYKVFPFEESKWNNDFFTATKNGDKTKIISLLKQANKVYLDEYFIDHSISELYKCDSKDSKKSEIISSLKRCKIINNVVEEKDNNTIFINTVQTPIKISRLSDIIPNYKISIPNSANPIDKTEYRCEYISQVLGFQNTIVKGYVYGIADKAKSVSTWVEFKNKNNQEFVVFPETNTVYNKEGFYYLKHAEPLKKTSSDDIKGKSSVGKFISFDSVNDIQDIEIDMSDFER